MVGFQIETRPSPSNHRRRLNSEVVQGDETLDDSASELAEFRFRKLGKGTNSFVPLPCRKMNLRFSAWGRPASAQHRHSNRHPDR
jgi:hypothetical protein